MIQTVLTTVEGVWLFLLRITETAPIGVWSFLIATVVPACLTPRLFRALPESWHPASRGFFVETAALVAGIGLAWLPWQTLPGALVGIVAGLLSPYLTRGWLAAWGVGFRWWSRRLGDPPFGSGVSGSVGGINPDPNPYWNNHPPTDQQQAGLERAEVSQLTPRRTYRPPPPPPGGDPP